MPGARTGLRMGHAQMIDSMITDGLWDAFNDYHMGVTAENLAAKYDIDREQQDAFAARSQQRASAALEAGRFADEITPVMLPSARAIPSPLPATSSRAQALPPRRWPNCGQPSRRMAASPPAMPRASTTVRPRSS